MLSSTNLSLPSISPASISPKYVYATNVYLTQVSIDNDALRTFIIFQRRLHEFSFAWFSQNCPSSLEVFVMMRKFALFIRGIHIPPRYLTIY